MKYRCPYCGNEVKDGQCCENCHMQIDWAVPMWKAGIWYYNEGLKKAKSRKLTLAADDLKKAVAIDKYNIEARNLLGLIYYEMGEIGCALKQWIISQSLQKEENAASVYIEDVQKEAKQLEQWKEAAALYNKSLEYVKQKDIDMAAIRLKKAVGLIPKFVKARVLLGLCYMQEKNYTRAAEHIGRALAVDAGHPEALAYYYELNKQEMPPMGGYEKAHLKNEMEHAAVGVEKLVDRSTMFSHGVLYFILGGVVLFIVYTYLILPSKVAHYKERIGQLAQSEAELQQNMEQMTTDYDQKLSDLEKNKVELQDQVAQYEQKIDVYSQKEKITSAQTLRDEGNYEEAAAQLYNISEAHLDEADAASYKALKEEIYQLADERLYDEAMTLYNNAEYGEAAAKFEAILLYEPKERMTRRTLYRLGRCQMQQGNNEEARKYFNKLISEYEGSYEANEAEVKLNELAD